VPQVKTDQRGRIRNPAVRYLLYEFLAQRDGRKCAKCGSPDSERELIINHIDGNTLNTNLTNLNLLCRSCNVPQKRTVPMDTIPYVRERVIVQGEHGLMLVDASPEIRLNRAREPQWRRWLMDRLISEGRVLLRDAINGGAEFCHISPTTARRYLAKMLSSEGPLYVLEETWVAVKPDHWAHLAEQPDQEKKQ